MRAKYAGNLQAFLRIGYSTGQAAFSRTAGGTSTASPSTGMRRAGRHYDIERAKSLPPDAPTDDAYVKVDQTPLEWARYPADIVRLKAEEWQGYQQRFPAMVDKKIFLSIDEYAYFGGGFGEA